MAKPNYSDSLHFRYFDFGYFDLVVSYRPPGLDLTLPRANRAMDGPAGCLSIHLLNATKRADGPGLCGI